MKKVISILLCILMIFSIYIPIPVNAERVVGEIGRLSCGGEIGLEGGASSTPNFRIGIISEDFDPPLEYGTEKNVDKQIAAHYKNHFLNLQNSIIIVPKKNQVNKSHIKVGWCEASSGDLLYVNPTDIDKKVRFIDTSNIKTGYDIFFYQLMGLVKDNDISTIGTHWKDIYSNTDDVEKQCLGIMNYIFYQWDNLSKDSIIQKINDICHYHGRVIDIEEKIKNNAGYIQMLMILYALVPDGSKAIYEDAINRYINFVNLDNKPVLIGIDTVATFTSKAWGSDNLLLPATEYIEYSAGITEANSLTKTTNNFFANTDPIMYRHQEEIILKAAKNSMVQQPDRYRCSSLVGTPHDTTALAWGAALVYGHSHYLKTHKKDPYFKDLSKGKKTVGIMEYLQLVKDKYEGFVVATIINLSPPPLRPSGKFGVSVDNPYVLLDAHSTTINQKDPVNLTGMITKEEEEIWNKVTYEKGYPKIKVGLTSNMTSTIVTRNTTENAGKGKKLQSSQVTGDDKTWDNISKDNLMNFLKGEKPITFTHDLINQKIDEGEIQTYEYTGNIQVKTGPEDEDIVTLTGDPAIATKKYENALIPLPVIRSYSSLPSYWSEIKQGSPYHESFEAMAGVPTTEKLYFASGGSEFIVDVTLEYCENQEATRKYKSYFTGVPSEFKEGDQAGNYEVGGFTFNAHEGGSYTKTWSDSIPWTGTHSASGWHGGGVKDKWNYNKQKAAHAEAKAYAAKVNGTVISHTAASDGKTRKFSDWNASVSGGITEGSGGSWTDGSDPEPRVPPSGKKGEEGYNPGKPAKKGVPAKSSAGTAGHYSYSVTVTLPAHVICGPEHLNDMPDIVDTWTQNITYDTLKITNVQVWKIDKSCLNGMKKITGSDEIKASVVQGNPNIFYNIAEKEDSKSGRLRYSIEPQQHDNVIWNEGPRSDKSNGLGRNTVTGEGGQGHSASYADGILYTNNAYPNDGNYLDNTADSKDKKTIEYDKFKERRETENTATVISDFLILQTSSGDQSIMYFEKDSEPTKTQDNFKKVTIPLSNLWENNNKSASDMEPEDINIGSYNGKFYNTNSKYNGNGGNVKIKTIFDSDPAHTIVRPLRPYKDLRLMKTGIDIIDKNKNDEYITGKSSLFYKHILSIGDNNTIYQDKYTKFGKGIEFPTKYSDSHNKINDIVIHNPVSTQYAMIIPEDDKYDQRTSKSKIIGGNLVPDTVETETKLKKTHELQNFIYNGDAEISDSQGNILNWVGHPLNKDVTYESKSNEIISGKNSLTVVAKSNLNKTEKYQSTTIGMPNTDYQITAKIKAQGCEGYLLVEAYNGEKKLKDWIFGKNHSGGIVNISETFKTPYNTDKIKVSVVNGASRPNTGSKEIVSADDIRLVKVGSQSDSWKTIPYTEYINTEVSNSNYVKPYTIDNPEYVPEKKIPNPDYKPSHKGETKVFNYTGRYKTYTAPVTGTYTLEVWGAQGSNGSGGLGGYATGKVDLTKGERLYIYTGGSNGFNGGGSGHGRSSQCGGGGTDIRRKGNSLTNRIIVAGGGGGRGDRGSGSSGRGGSGGGTTGGTGGDRYGSPGQGGSQSYGGSGGDEGGSSGRLGIGGSNYTGDNSGGGGGGGGYYGGGAGGNDQPGCDDNDDSGGGGGSGYVGGVSNGTMKTGVREGDGVVKITEPNIQGNSEPEFIIIPAKGERTIRVNNANYIPASDSYAGDWSKGKVSLGNIGISSVLSTHNNILKNTSFDHITDPSDVMVSKKYIYVVHGNLDCVSKYNKTPNGDIGNYISSGNWIKYDCIDELSTKNSSVPAAYTVYTDYEDKDHLIGWSKSNSNIIDYEISSNNTLTNKKVIKHNAGSISWYSRSGWDGDNYIYFYNKNNNKLYKFDLFSKELSYLTTLANGNSIMSSSYTGSGLIVDKKNNEIYGCSGMNSSNGLLGIWNLSTGRFKGKITGDMLKSAGLPTISNNTGSIQLNPLNRNIAYYFGNYHNDIISLEIVLRNKANSYTSAKGIPWIPGLSPTSTSSSVIENNLSTPPKNWYEIVETKIPANPTIEIPGLGDKTAGKMVVLGRDFDVYFPNEGDFYDDGSYGIAHTTTHRGKGFVDHMDTTKWTKEKQVSFNFDVIYENKMYRVGEYIDLDVDEDMYNFKVPISNSEAVSAEVNFRVLANNGTFIDNNKDTNKKREKDCSAYHSAIKKYNIDVVGRIGNLVMEDTTDYRFSNYFKNPVTPTKWFIDNVVKKVDIESQNNYLGANVNIFGDPIDSRHYLNTFGSLDFLQESPKQFPLSPSDNNIQALKKQPTRLGYYMLMDIETVGNYYNNMQIIPYYYSLNLDTGDTSPVDVYANVQGSYQPINIYDNVVPDWNTDSVYKNYIALDWLDNSGRRNYGGEEKTITEYVKSKMIRVTETGDAVPIDIPRDNGYKYGITQILQLKERNRTFIGTTTEDGEDFNPGNKIPEYDYNRQAQRWHFSVGVPSSSVFVEAGKELTKTNMDKVMNNKTVILATLDIKASGNTYVLEYKHPEGNNTIDIVGKKYNISSIKHNVVGIYSSEKSSAEDLDTSGTH
ncbi:hypothetical protein SH1V18_11220 [Vallitalea longa]|uniref:receptor protein-tyrosine kinase n=1 Tax=Vallitalea longa TaxID=2936439 RepID=A0A9W5Y7V1_9FIRM|nr:glycine rich domain-containing protein [Vallitalea longa]GKX28642.1 hypothetical protein SH1V18_11220 [Vallitalea longa]